MSIKKIYWDELEVGDIVLERGGAERKVLCVLNEIFALSVMDDFDSFAYWMTNKEADQQRLRIKNEFIDIEILGKKYLKHEVEEKLKELKEIK